MDIANAKPRKMRSKSRLLEANLKQIFAIAFTLYRAVFFKMDHVKS